jgi:hypothetical protein
LEPCFVGSDGGHPHVRCKPGDEGKEERMWGKKLGGKIEGVKNKVKARMDISLYI